MNVRHWQLCSGNRLLWNQHSWKLTTYCFSFFFRNEGGIYRKAGECCTGQDYLVDLFLLVWLMINVTPWCPNGPTSPFLKLHFRGNNTLPEVCGSPHLRGGGVCSVLFLSAEACGPPAKSGMASVGSSLLVLLAAVSTSSQSLLAAPRRAALPMVGT